MILKLLLAPFCLFILPLLFFITRKSSSSVHKKPTPKAPTTLPQAYPIIGSYLSVPADRQRRLPWISDILCISPSATFTVHRLFGKRSIFTANPTVVQHILKTHFNIYQKGETFRHIFSDFLGNGIFNSDGDNWKFQRQVASHEFTTNSLRKFVEHVVDTELSDRLLPILSTNAAQNKTLDFQDILQRFGFDNICKIAFGFDPESLSLSLEQAKFATSFEEGVQISTERLDVAIPLIWKIKKVLNIGSEKRLRIVVSEVREFAKKIVREKKNEIKEKSTLDSVDLLSRFLNSGHSDEDFVADIVISFILAGKDTTSSALTWFFWLISKSPRVESEIFREITAKLNSPVFEEVKDMVYTHAALCESMRLYPPVPLDSKEALTDDVLPEGTVVKKGMRVIYHIYAMGRSERIWGSDWARFRPERWLEREGEKWRFVGRDSYSYPVFQGGPRICLGKEMAFLQMKRVVAGVLREFKVVPVEDTAEGNEPVFVAYLSSKMKDGFPVRIEKRNE